MDAIELLQEVERRLEKEEESLSFDIASGRLVSWEEYRDKTGYLRGIKKSRQLIRDALADYNEKDD